MRLIDADVFEVFGYDSQEGTFDDGVRFVLEKIDATPTIDAVEVVRGEWIKRDDGTICSNCGFALEDWTQGIFYNFCPNCGARMRKGAEQ